MIKEFHQIYNIINKVYGKITRRTTPGQGMTSIKAQRGPSVRGKAHGRMARIASLHH